MLEEDGWTVRSTDWTFQFLHLVWTPIGNKATEVMCEITLRAGSKQSQLLQTHFWLCGCTECIHAAAWYTLPSLILAFRVGAGKQRGENKDKGRKEEEEQERQSAGSLPCPLSMTFLVNSSSPPPTWFQWEEDWESWDDLSTTTRPRFISASCPFYHKKDRCWSRSWVWVACRLHRHPDCPPTPQAAKDTQTAK